jgi:hypothetical protein
MNHDAAWFARQLAHCDAVLAHLERQHTDEEIEAAGKRLAEYERKAGRSAPQQQELMLAA